MTKDEFFEKNQEGLAYYETIPGHLLCSNIELCANCYYNKANKKENCNDLVDDWKQFKRKSKLKKLLEK